VLSLGAATYIASDKTLRQRSGLAMRKKLRFTVNRLLAIGNASQHSPKFFRQSLQSSLFAKLFYYKSFLPYGM